MVRRRTFWLELLFFAGSVGLMAAFVQGLAWGYPMGRDTVWTIGGLAILAVAAMGAPSLLRAWAARRAA